MTESKNTLRNPKIPQINTTTTTKTTKLIFIYMRRFDSSIPTLPSLVIFDRPQTNHMETVWDVKR